MTELLTYVFDEGIATITLDDGKVNALSIPMLIAIDGALDRAEADGAVVVITGREGRFSGGFDLKTFQAGVEPLVEMLRRGAEVSSRVLSFPHPVVVACSGHAIAAGTFLALAADVRIGADGPFRLGLNETRIGLTLPWYAVELARYRLAPAHFDRAVVNAYMHTPAEAAAAGFLDRVVAPGELMDAARAAATELAGLDRGAHAATKLRARGAALEAIRRATDSEITVEGLTGSG